MAAWAYRYDDQQPQKVNDEVQTSPSLSLIVSGSLVLPGCKKTAEDPTPAADATVTTNTTATDTTTTAADATVTTGTTATDTTTTDTTADASLDTDKDGLTDLEEKAFGTDPNLADTDSDGLDDLKEIKTYKTSASRYGRGRVQ